ncbi:MAG: hypothetical protein GY756_27130 [bacterium]|nr:hypothetical protein [bacterium]
MLNINHESLLLLSEMRIDALYETAERERMISIQKREKISKPSKAVSFILIETGKALVSAGNHLLKIA